MVSRRVHSRYRRQLADTASGGQEVLIHLEARRFFCGNGACAKGTFAEQIPGLTSRYGRRTCGLDSVLVAVAMALGGRAGARLTGRLACSASRSTLLRLIRAAPDPDDGTPLVLGVDDFALRKGPGLCLGARPCADRPRALPATVLDRGPGTGDRGPGPVPGGGHPR